MDYCETKRKLENEQDCGFDIISDLPDTILEKIQSLLPTKDAIATSFLSTRWKNLSPFSYPPIKLDLEYPLSRENYWKRSYSLLDSFADFVDKLFKKTLRNVPCIETFRLHCDGYCGDTKIISWIRAALRLKVGELLLDIRISMSKPFFGALNGCMTLTRLDLGKGFSVLVPNGFALPKLKRLCLYKLKFLWEDGDMFDKLISGSPEIEDMRLNNCEFRNWKGGIRIRSSVLKKFTIIKCMQATVELDVANLEVLQCIKSTAKILSRVKSLTEAQIEADWNVQLTRVDGLVALVSACSNAVRHQYLDSSAIVAWQRSHVQLPTFQKLTSLVLGCVSKSGGWSFLARLLLSTPNLEKLVFKKGFIISGYSAFESLLPNPPLCLELHLREIEFKVFKEKDDELKLVEYFLRNGKVIQKLKVHCLPFKKTKTSRLLMLPKHSKIDFHPRNIMCGTDMNAQAHQLLFPQAPYSRGN